jgi:hypothetical protein
MSRDIKEEGDRMKYDEEAAGWAGEELKQCIATVSIRFQLWFSNTSGHLKHLDSC